MIARTVLLALALAAPGFAAASGPVPKAVTRLQAVGTTTVFTLRQGAPEAARFAVVAREPGGSGVPGARVTWTMPAFCGLFAGASRASVLTGADGVANPPEFVAGNRSMTCTVRAEAEGTALRVDFTVYIFTASELTMQVTPATVETTQRGTFSITAELRGAGGMPLPGLPIDFEVRPQSSGAAAILDRYTGTADAATSRVTVRARGNERLGNYTIVARNGPAEALARVTQVSTGSGNPGAARTLSGYTPTSTGVVVLMHDSETLTCGFENSTLFALGEGALPPPPVGLRFPHGLLRAQTTRCSSSQDLAFTLLLPQPPPAGAALWRYGRTAANAQPHWYAMPVTASSNAVMFSIRDGADGDDDLAVNGALAFTGGIAYLDSETTYQDHWWAGTAENGWGGGIFQDGERIFAAFFHYDGAGNPAWSVMNAALDTTRTRLAAPLLTATGSPFYAYDPSRLAIATAGQATLTFTDSEHAVLDFTLAGGASARKNLVRQAFGRATASSAPPARTGMFYGGAARTGFGLSVVQQFDALFVAWFTYDSAGHAYWYVAPGGAWTNADTWVGKAYRTKGSPWAAYDPAKLEVEEVGTFTLRYTGPDSLVFEYSVEGRVGVESLVRQPL